MNMKLFTVTKVFVVADDSGLCQKYKTDLLVKIVNSFIYNWFNITTGSSCKTFSKTIWKEPS